MSDTIQAYLMGVLSGVFLLAGIYISYINLKPSGDGSAPADFKEQP